jgi:hypothetical protein
MPLNTPAGLIAFALKAAGVLGVGQSALAEDYNDAFDALNSMIAIWARKRWLIWHLIDVSVPATGALSYSIGIGGDFNTPRPDRIEAAFFRLMVASPTAPVDYPLTILESREDYNRIALKSLASSMPGYVFYDSAFPTGVVYPWPLARAGIGEIHLSVKETLSQFTGFTQNVNMPAEYQEAIWTNLTVRLAPIYQYDTRPEVIALAKSSLATIRGANTQIPRLTIPKHLISKRSGGAGYPVFGGGPATPSLGDLNALLATLPTTLPGAPGILWNNGGMLSIS